MLGLGAGIKSFGLELGLGSRLGPELETPWGTKRLGTKRLGYTKCLEAVPNTANDSKLSSVNFHRFRM